MQLFYTKDCGFITWLDGEWIAFDEWMKTETHFGFVLQSSNMFTDENGLNAVRVVTEYRREGNETFRSNAASYGAAYLAEQLNIH